MKNTIFDWSTALRNFNHHQCQYSVHIAPLLIIQIFASALENESNPISQTQGQLLENKVTKDR